MTEDIGAKDFSDMGLSVPLLKALKELGYESPSPIQQRTIPLVMAKQDLVGQAQTGTGKTAAFALPLLQRINLKGKIPQVLVLTPTRELTIQVAEAFQTYAKWLKGFHVLPIYGGQEYGIQLRALKRGVQVVVGTPGRIMDHMRRNTLKLDQLDCLVLDEADEMLRMGFLEDVEWILEKTPLDRQVVLFSATMPTEINKIAQKYLKDPQQIIIKNKTVTVEAIEQHYWVVSSTHKLDVLTRILETEDTDGIIIFVRTRVITVELAEKLQARGYAAAVLNGDLQQKQRERTISQLKSGKLDILIATDVAARGLDVERISHVINYDIPNETEAYIHRIGRTGRAGRTGKAILFVTPREQHLLRRIEKITRQKIAMMELPSVEMINDKRVERFKQNISAVLAKGNLEFYQQIIEDYQQEHNIPAAEIAAALAKLVQGNEPLLLKALSANIGRQEKSATRHKNNSRSNSRRLSESKTTKNSSRMEMYQIDVGHDHAVQASNIVGAIANEAGLGSKNIGRIDIHDSYSLVELPEGMPKDIFYDLKKTWVAGQKLNIKRASQASGKKNQSPKHMAGKLRKRSNTPHRTSVKTQ